MVYRWRTLYTTCIHHNRLNMTPQNHGKCLSARHHHELGMFMYTCCVQISTTWTVLLTPCSSTMCLNLTTQNEVIWPSARHHQNHGMDQYTCCVYTCGVQHPNIDIMCLNLTTQNEVIWPSARHHLNLRMVTYTCCVVIVTMLSLTCSDDHDDVPKYQHP